MVVCFSVKINANIVFRCEVNVNLRTASAANKLLQIRVA